MFYLVTWAISSDGFVQPQDFAGVCVHVSDYKAFDICFVDRYHLRIGGKVEKDHTTAERGHTHALHPTMGMQEAVVRVQRKVQSWAEVQVQTVMPGNQPAVGPPVSDNGRKSLDN